MGRSKFPHGHQTKVGRTTRGSATCFNIVIHRLNSLCDSRVPVDVLAMHSFLFYKICMELGREKKNQQEEKKMEMK